MQNKFHFHAGERAVQTRAGEAFIADQNGVVIAESILGGARPFIEKQFMVVLSSIDNEGMVWSSILYGRPGFARAESATVVSLNIPCDSRDSADPFWHNIEGNPSVGMLFIELGSRRRYRINGTLKTQNEERIEITVREAYPNCPKYIQRRHLRNIEDESSHGSVSKGTVIPPELQTLIHSADTMFVASSNAETGADASHRGGTPGFIQIINDSTLRIPDFQGNSLFNTLGNVELNPRTGWCIPDFEGQQLLQLTGRSRLLWDQDDPKDLTGGTRRFWELEIDRWILRPVTQLLEWEYLDASPFNPPSEH